MAARRLRTATGLPTISRMCNRWLRLLPLFIAALWLPFQAVAAVAMPFCRHGEAHKTLAMVDETVEHCQMHGQQATQPDHGMDCDDCGFCHLAGAGFMPAAEQVAALIPTDRDFSADFELPPASTFPEPPRQPPKRLT
ncbi:MAG: DUF2946 family protein [Rhodocyclaceae bacterium]|nr:DUF2946 family protein [Rhodocyclaceae bacterium]